MTGQADAAVVDSVARVLYEKWRTYTVPPPKATWDELVAEPWGRDGDFGVGVAVWRDWARAAIAAYEGGARG